MSISLAELEERWLREGAANDQEYETFLVRRRGGEPLHRILGWREFWGLRFYLSPDTLEPRPDSETIIDVLLKLRPERDHAYRMLDLGTGTGCLLLAALSEFPNATGIGIDAAPGAVAAAQKNAERLGLSDRAEFRTLSWYQTDALQALGRFDIILCNPPYIPHAHIATLEPEVREHDPTLALDGGEDGLEAYRHLSAHLEHLLRPRAIALFEIGYDQGIDVQDILLARGFDASTPYPDLGRKDRVITASLEQNVE